MRWTWFIGYQAAEHYLGEGRNADMDYGLCDNGQREALGWRAPEVDASERFEILLRSPRDPILGALERGAVDVVGDDWRARLGEVFNENLGVFRKYDAKFVKDLLRALRAKKHHYQDLPENVERHLGPMPKGICLILRSVTHVCFCTYIEWLLN
ncbi:hypothetical protein BDZ89DRAFT_1170301 [Hymenopellis radicata]|nr:hypothetical protein BDZ89DRAFT_1170301 [Hymenopellis radicata]